MSRLKIAVVGAGHLGRIHSRLLAAQPEMELVGVVDPFENARNAVAAEAKTAALADVKQLPADLAAVVIATPTPLHHRVALDFLKRGVHVLVEKPITSTLEEADELIAAADRSGAVLQVGHVERFNPTFRAVAGQLARPRYIEAIRSSGYTGRSIDVSVVHDIMIHDIDLVLSLCPAKLLDVHAVGACVFGPHIDMAQARLSFADGCVVNLTASRVNMELRRQMQVICDSHFTSIDFNAKTAKVIRPNEQLLAGQVNVPAMSAAEKTEIKDNLFTHWLPVTSVTPEDRNAIVDEHADFAQAIRTGSSPCVDGRQGRLALAVAEWVCQSVAEHRYDDAPLPSTGSRPAAGLTGPHWGKAPTPTSPQRKAG